MSETTAKNLKPRPPSSAGPQQSSSARPPIVVVMGHVDHGKTTLLDYIRKTNVAEREAGGITQSIGAYEIVHTQTNDEEGLRESASGPHQSAPSEGRRITFIDTPGHEAFIKMRSRGATIADLAILVVAADEGVKPQTQESIKILGETKTPFVVAITKIDKPNADVEKVKNELTAAGVLLEGYGGHVSFEPVSAKTGEHVNELLDFLLLAADVERFSYDPGTPASGFVLETRIDRQRGLEATVIVKNGILKQGETIATPASRGRIKILENFQGDAVKTLEPSAPALIIGFETLPQVGEEFTTGEAAIATAERRAEAAKAAPLPTAPASHEASAGGPEGETGTLRLILKASDAGSLEALSQIMRTMAASKPMQVVGESVGDVNDNDVKLAISTKAVVVAFKSKTDKGAKILAESNRITVISSDVVYELIKAAEEFLVKLAEPEAAGVLEILAVFSQKKPEKQIVGGKVVAGAFGNKSSVSIEREGNVIGKGRVLNLQQQKKDASQVNEGNEAGVLVNSETLIKAGDKLIIR